METAENKRFVYEFGKFVLDPSDKILFADGVPQHLPAKEFDTLLLLVENNGRALSKNEMMAAVWHDSFVEEANLAKQISKLRKIFNTNGDRFIETIPKHGYRFSADLRRTTTPIEEPAIIEKRTIKRVTFAVENVVEPEHAVLPPAKRSFFTLKRLAIASIGALILVGVLMWRFGPDAFSNTNAIDPYAAVRLTDNTEHDTFPFWTRDGSVHFSRIYSDNRIESWRMNGDGSSQSVVDAPEGKRIFSWSPDEQKILYQKQGDATKTYLAGSDGTGERPLPFRSGTWSADSRMIAYHQKVAVDNFDIFIYSVDTGESRNITNSEFFDADPSFSPEGNQIVFTGNRDGNPEIYSLNLDGSGLRRLTFDPSTDSHPAFSPDGTQILFTSNRENENADAYVMNADGSGTAAKLTDWDKSNETVGPGGWSPDGTKIVFVSDRSGDDDIYLVSAEIVRPKLVLANPNRDIRTASFSPDGKKIVYSEELDDKTGELKILDMESGNTVQVTKTDLPSTVPDWSPDANLIAFHDRVNGNSEICVIRPDGSDSRNLTNDPAQDTGPAWSSDGRRLVFASSRGYPPNIPQIYTMNADGSEARAVTQKKGWEGDPAWTPDGNSIVFVCDRTDAPGYLLDVCQINVDGSGEKRLLFYRDHDARPVVSPDGRRIAFTARSDGNLEIYLMNSDGSGLRRVTRNPADDVVPKWSPDGRRLLFTSNRNGKFAIYEIEM